MTQPIPRSEILPEGPKEPLASMPETKEVPSSLDAVERKLKNLRGRKNEKGEATDIAKAEVEGIRQEIESLSTTGVDTSRVDKLRVSLAELTEEMKKDVPLEPVAAAPETEQTFLGIDRKTLTQAGTALGVVAAGTALVIAWKACRAWFGRGKEIVKEKTEKGFRWMKWIGLATAGGLLTFFGLKTLQERMIKGTLEKTKAELKDAGQKTVDTVTQAGKDAVEQAKEATKDASAAAADTANAALNSAEAEKFEKELQTMTKEEVTARMVIAEHAGEWGLDDASKKSQIIGLMKINATETMNDIEARRDDATQESPLAFPKETKDLPNREQSVDALLDYCDEHRQQAIESVQHEKKCDVVEAERLVGEMFLSTYLEYTLSGMSMYVRAASELEKGAGSFAQLMEALKNMDFAYILKGDQYVDAVCKEIVTEANQADLGISNEEIAEINFIDLLQSAMSLGNIPILDANKTLSDPKTPSDKILKFIYAKILHESNTTHKVILPLFYDVFPSDMEKPPEERVRTYLLERMTTAEALRFYMYHRILSQGNAAVLPLMQMEVIRFIARHDTGLLQGTRKHTAMTRMGITLFTGSGGKILDEWEEMNLDLHLDVTDDEKKMMKYLGTKILLAPINGGLEYVKTSVGVFNAYRAPIALGITGIAAAKVAWIRSRALGTGEVNLKAIGQNITALPDVLEQKGTKVWIAKNMRQALSSMVATHDDITEVKSAWTTIFKEGIEKHSDQKMVGKATGLFRDCISQPRRASNWKRLSVELFDLATKTGSDELLKAAEKAEKMSSPSKEFARARRFFGAIHIGFRTSFPVAAASLGSQPAISATAVVIDRVTAYGIDRTKDAYSVLQKSPFIGDVLKSAGVSLENILDAVRKVNMPPQLAELFAKSRGGMNMLVDAFRRKGAQGVAYITKLGNCIPAPVRKIVGTSAALGLDAIFIMLERSLLDGKIKETDSAALKEFYEEQKNLAFVSSVPTAGFLALGAGPGILLTGVYVGTKATSDYFNAATIDWLKSDKDMAKLPPGELLSKLTDIAPGTQGWLHQNAARGDSLFGGSMLESDLRKSPTGRALSTLGIIESAEKKDLERFEVTEKTNNGQRGKLTQAYLANMTYLEPRSDESEAEYKERFARFQTEQNAFIARVSEGNFGPQSADTYRKAHGHAELTQLSEELKARNASQFIPLIHDEGSGHFVHSGDFDIAKYGELPPFGQADANGISRYSVIKSMEILRDASTAEWGLVAHLLDSEGEQNEDKYKIILAHQLFTAIRYELSSLDSKITEADVKGWGWTGGEEATRETLRHFIRTELHSKVEKESEILVSQSNAVLDDVMKVVSRLRSFLQQDVSGFEALAAAGGAAEQPVSDTAIPGHTLDWRMIEPENRLAA